MNIYFVYVNCLQIQSITFVFKARDTDNMRLLEHLSFGPLSLDLFSEFFKEVVFESNHIDQSRTKLYLQNLIHYLITKNFISLSHLFPGYFKAA